MTETLFAIWNRLTVIADVPRGVPIPAPEGVPTGYEQIAQGVQDAAQATANAANGAAPVAAAEPSMWPMLMTFGIMFIAMYFLMIRPQRKREKQMRELQSSISRDDYVITSSGLFGKVAEVGEDCFIVEFGTNRPLRVPVLKGDVVAKREPKMTPQPKTTVELEKTDK